MRPSRDPDYQRGAAKVQASLRIFLHFFFFKGRQEGDPRMAREAQAQPGIIRVMEVPIMATDTTKQKSWVKKTPNVCGGDACIRNTRITVNGLVEWRKLGLADERIVEIIEGL